MSLTLRAVLCVCALLLAPAVHAGAYSSLYVFGDSLSDQGNVSLLSGGAIPPSEYTDGVVSGRFTNGQNYVDRLETMLGISSGPVVIGGNNWAFGGSRLRGNSVPGAPGVLDQRDGYLFGLGGAAADPRALYMVWAGSNDVSDLIDAVVADPTFDPFPGLAAVAADMKDVVGSLLLQGARHLVVPNVPDLGLVPLVTGGGPPIPFASFITATYNSLLDLVLDELVTAFPGADLLRFDTFSLLNDVYLDPIAYGFGNVTDACYSAFVMPGGVSCADPDQYLSWDGFHPTAAAHRLIAQQLFAALPIPVPGGWVLLLVGVLLLRRSWRNTASVV